ncbi:uncharacterized protein LOC143607564 [Bidens hawaiensis]|uniref:uncharacterized protein LOC143607564 n=1 Tax=Bidens hawaiensis TaxID=980011 RepID=UPI0040491E4F
MADMKMNEAKISIKVIVDKVKRRVLYAVADHTFVDILFSFIALPLGTIARILGKLDDKKFEVLGSLTIFCAGGGVFVSNTATFVITDDLCVEPYTSASSIRLLTDFGVTDINHLEERNLDLSSHQVLQLLKMALSIDHPLTRLVFSEVQNSIRESVGSGQDISFDKSQLEKLLFADAKEDFVEFLFGFLSIPLGTVVGELMKGVSSVTCMNNIFKRISNMSVGRYLKSQDIKDMLLKPHIGQKFPSKHQNFTLSAIPPGSIKDEPNDPRVHGKLLKQCGTFVMTDDLTVTPLSSFSTIDILKKFKVLPEDIERYEVSTGLEEVSPKHYFHSDFYTVFHLCLILLMPICLQGLSMLKASLRSCFTLTTGLEHQLKKNELGYLMGF